MIRCAECKTVLESADPDKFCPACGSVGPRQNRWVEGCAKARALRKQAAAALDAGDRPTARRLFSEALDIELQPR